MCQVITNPDGSRLIKPSKEECEALDWMERAFGSRKFEKFIEDYLKSRHLNMKVQEDKQILAQLTEEERANIRARIKKDK
jgi:hypothetical protein